jgi:hypothetical protein
MGSQIVRTRIDRINAVTTSLSGENDMWIGVSDRHFWRIVPVWRPDLAYPFDWGLEHVSAGNDADCRN